MKQFLLPPFFVFVEIGSVLQAGAKFMDQQNQHFSIYFVFDDIKISDATTFGSDVILSVSIQLELHQ